MFSNFVIVVKNAQRASLFKYSDRSLLERTFPERQIPIAGSLATIRSK